MKRKRDHKKSKKDCKPVKQSPLWARLSLAILSPLVFIVIVELVLSLAGYGRARTFFVKWRYQNQSVYLTNHHYCEHFVPRRLSRTPEYSILSQKTPKTRRIFVFGGSAAYGDPEPALGFCRQLEVLLNTQSEDVSYEVINAAVTSMNSHVARRIALDCTHYEPDLFIVYMGNNEVVGPYGPPTLPSFLYAKRGYINACITTRQQLRLVQLLSNCLENIRSSEQSNQEWLGMEAFLSTQITKNDPKLKYCYQHFRDNIRDIVMAAETCGIKTLLCTVPTNLRACAPFGSQHNPSFSAEQLTEWETHFNTGREHQQAGDFENALKHYEMSASLDNEYADLAYCMAQSLEALGRLDEAGTLYHAACDLDTLRFRADSTINKLIHAQAEALAEHGAVLFDMVHNLEQVSEGKPLGSEVLMDHVHLSFTGNFLAAYFALPRIRACLPDDSWANNTRTQEQLFDMCAGRLLYDSRQQRNLIAIMYSRKTRPPFINQIDHDRELENLRNTLIQIYRQTRGVQTSEEEIRESLKHRPLDPYLNRYYGRFLINHNRIGEAVDLYEKFLEVRLFNMMLRIESANAQMQLHRKEKALDMLTSKLTPYRYDKKEALLALGSDLIKQGRFIEAESLYLELLELDSKNIDTLINLAVIYGQKGATTKVKTYLDKALKLDPASTKAMINMGNYYASINQPEAALKWFAKAVDAEPHNYLAHLGLGAQKVRNNNLKEGLVHILKAVELKPDFARGYEVLAAIYKQTGQEERVKVCSEFNQLFSE